MARLSQAAYIHNREKEDNKLAPADLNGGVLNIQMKLSFQKMFYAIATVFALFAILVLASSILIPLSIALLMSFVLFPVAKKFESWKMNRMLASFLSIAAVILVAGGIIFLFLTQIIELSKEFTHFKDKIVLAFAAPITTAMAILFPSKWAMIIARLFFVLKKIPYPKKCFANMTEARAWLRDCR